MVGVRKAVFRERAAANTAANEVGRGRVDRLQGHWRGAGLARRAPRTHAAPGGADEHNCARDDESRVSSHCQAKPRLHDGERHSRHGPGLDVLESEKDAREDERRPEG